MLAGAPLDADGCPPTRAGGSGRSARVRARAGFPHSRHTLASSLSVGAGRRRCLRPPTPCVARARRRFRARRPDDSPNPMDCWELSLSEGEKRQAVLQRAVSRGDEPGQSEAAPSPLRLVSHSRNSSSRHGRSGQNSPGLGYSDAERHHCESWLVW